VLDSTYQLLAADDYRGYRGGNKPRDRNAAGTTTATTVNRLLLTNVTRWHPIMSQRPQTVGTARLTCQASNSITAFGYSRPSLAAGTGNTPPPATTEHTIVRLNRK